MKILVAGKGIVAMIAHEFTFGAWEEADKIGGVTVHKWKAEDENGNTTMYLIDENRNAIDGTEEPGFKVYSVDEIPEGAEYGKYLYINGAFVENPNWEEPKPTAEERIAELEMQNEMLLSCVLEMSEIVYA